MKRRSLRCQRACSELAGKIEHRPVDSSADASISSTNALVSSMQRGDEAGDDSALRALGRD